MASYLLKVSQNIDGPYFVDQNCIACMACIKQAPEMFKLNEDSTQAYVYQMPKNTNNTKNFKIAMDLCPVESIGIKEMEFR